MKNLLLHAEYWISDELGFSLFLLSLKNPLTWAFIIYNVYVLIIMKPAQLFPERRDVPLSERVGGGTRAGSLYVFFLTRLRRRCLLFPQVSGKCAVSITVCLVSLQQWQCFCMEAWGLGASSVALWVRVSAVRGKERSGCGPPRHTHGLHVQLQRQSWTGLAAGSLLSLTGKQKEAAMDWF